MKQNDECKIEFVKLQLTVADTIKDVDKLDLKVQVVDARVDTLSEKFNDLDKRADRLNLDLIPLKKVIYGMIGIILVEFLTAILFLILNTVK